MTRRHLIALAGLGSALLLGGAFVFQALGYPPCAMCLWQRWPHAAAMVLAALGWFAPMLWLALAGALSAAITGGIGVFHTGVERGWWEGPTSCTSGGVGGISADDLLNQIMAAPLVRCDEVAWEMFGLSMATWNALASFALMAVWLLAFRSKS